MRNESRDGYHLQHQASWGNAIYFENKFKEDGTMKVHGAKSRPRVKDDDIVIARADDGAYVVCKLSEVRYESNPRDMFFAKVEYITAILVDEGDDLSLDSFIKYIEESKDDRKKTD